MQWYVNSMSFVGNYLAVQKLSVWNFIVLSYILKYNVLWLVQGYYMTLMPYYWAEILKFIVPRKDIFKPCCNHTYFLNLANIFFFKRKKWAVLQIFQHFWNVMAYLITSVYNVGSLIFSNILLHWNEISINFLYRKSDLYFSNWCKDT